MKLNILRLATILGSLAILTSCHGHSLALVSQQNKLETAAQIAEMFPLTKVSLPGTDYVLDWYGSWSVEKLTDLINVELGGKSLPSQTWIFTSTKVDPVYGGKPYFGGGWITVLDKPAKDKKAWVTATKQRWKTWIKDVYAQSIPTGARDYMLQDLPPRESEWL